MEVQADKGSVMRPSARVVCSMNAGLVEGCGVRAADMSRLIMHDNEKERRD